MPALIIFTRESTHNQNELNIYQSQVLETFEGHSIKRIAAGEPQILEGPARERTVVLEFPTIAAAQQWYSSPAYQAIKEHRLRGATFSVILIETA
jgi:uncharacterized protein (DUF1330 family)